MSLKQKIKGILATAGAIAMVAGTAFAATPQTVYEQAVQNAAQKPQGQYTMQFSAQVPVFGTASATSVIQVQQEPFIAKATTKMEAFGNKPSADILAYVEQDGKNLNFYYAEMKGKKLDWHKKTQQLKSDAPLAKDIKPLEHPLAGIKSITAAGDNAFDVVYSARSLYTDHDVDQWKKQGATDEQIRTAKKVLDAAKNAGDVTVHVTVDPATNRINHLSIPLTAQMRAMGMTLIDSVDTTDANKAMAQQFIQNSEVNMTVDYEALPAGTDLTIPSDVKKKAKADKK